MSPQTSFQANTEAISLRVLRGCFAEHSKGGELLGGGATSKVFFAQLSFIKESAEKAASHAPTFSVEYFVTEY